MTPPLRGSPGLGTWQRLEGRHYAASFQFFRLDNNAFAGVQRIIESIELSKDGDRFTAIGTSQVSDSSGTLIQEGCNTETATRIE